MHNLYDDTRAAIRYRDIDVRGHRRREQCSGIPFCPVTADTSDAIESMKSVENLHRNCRCHQPDSTSFPVI